MKRFLHFSIAIFSIILMAACARDNSADSFINRVEDAESAFATGNIDSARDICAALVSDSSDVDKCDQASRIYLQTSLLLTRVSEYSGDRSDEDMALAALCFNKAVKASPDSVADIVSSMDIEERSRMQLLRQLTGMIDLQIEGLEAPADSVSDDVVYADSICVNSDHSH